jgi:hypothetical protein
VQHRAARPVVRRDVLGLAGGVERDQDRSADRLSADLRGVVLEEPIVAVAAREVELLLVVELADSAARAGSAFPMYVGVTT